MSNSDQTNFERRLARRIRLTDSVQYQFQKEGQLIGSRAVDISETGIRLQVNDFVPLNTALLLQVQLAKEQVIECVGRVMWIMKMPFGENYQLGVTFTNDETIVTTKKEINQLIETRSS